MVPLDPVLLLAVPSGLRKANNVVSPEQIRPYPKAGKRKLSKKGRQPLRSYVLTATLIKTLKEQAKDRENKKVLQAERAKKKLYKSMVKEELPADKNKVIKKKNIVQKKQNKITNDESSESEDKTCLCLVCLQLYSKSKLGQDCLDKYFIVKNGPT